jgi:hypothetical protein
MLMMAYETWMAYGVWIAAAGVVVMGAAWTVLLWRAVRAIRAVGHLEARVAGLTEALALLTDTTETGFRSIGEQLVAPAPTVSARPARRAPARTRRTTTSRVVRAARGGQSVPEIAAAEHVSEGEVRLRQYLANAAVGKTKGE